MPKNTNKTGSLSTGYIVKTLGAHDWEIELNSLEATSHSIEILNCAYDQETGYITLIVKRTF